MASSTSPHFRKHEPRLYFDTQQLEQAAGNYPVDKPCHFSQPKSYLSIAGMQIYFKSKKGFRQRLRFASSCGDYPDPAHRPAACHDLLPVREADWRWVLDFDDVLRNSNVTANPAPHLDGPAPPASLAARVKFDSGTASASGVLECANGYMRLDFRTLGQYRAQAESASVRLSSWGRSNIEIWGGPIGSEAKLLLKLKDGATVSVVHDLGDKTLCHDDNDDFVLLTALLDSPTVKMKMPDRILPSGCEEPLTPRSNCSPAIMAGQ
jgi:hypothetical protein